jgi:ABC-type antimicrobial peptide transport system ATPase subunit
MDIFKGFSRRIADQTLVMHRRHVVEQGLTADALDAPQQACRQTLDADVPHELSPGRECRQA